MQPLSMLQVMSTAMDNAREGITIADATLPDNPLIYVNKGFLVMTDYTYEEVIGRNCRFLQGNEVDIKTKIKLKEAIQKGESVVVELINYTKYGVPFWNRLSITPVTDSENKITHYIGIQDDITAERKRQLNEKRVAEQQLKLQATIAAQEKERCKIGQELHDNVNQMLTTAKLYLEMSVSNELHRIPMIQKSKSIILDAIQELRKLSQSLVGPNLSSVSLIESLQQLVIDVQNVSTFQIVLKERQWEEENIAEEKKLMLYRIVQEQLNNIIKYANANRVTIELERESEKIKMVIKDNGSGFDTKKKSKGIGLQNINNRVKQARGVVKLHSTPVQGTEMCVELPV